MHPRLVSSRRLFAALFALLTSATYAASSVVNTTNDTVNGSDGVTSLREAIIAANSGGGTITFDATTFAPAGGPYTIQLTSVLPNLAANITITGPGANVLTVNGEGFNPPTPYRIFNVTSGSTVGISGLTISNGRAAGTNGATGTVGQGGAILNAGSLTLTECAFTSNTAQGGSGSGTGATGGKGQGGAIFSTGPLLTVQRCTFTSNSVTGGGGGNGAFINSSTHGPFEPGGNAADGQGGAIYANAPTGVTITNSTFYSNSATGGTGGGSGFSNSPSNDGTGGAGGIGDGGAIYSAQALTVTSCTIAGNSANGGAGGTNNSFNNVGPGGNGRGGGIFSGGTVTSGNTLVASNSATPGNSTNPGTALGPDVFGTFSSNNFNLIGILTAAATGFGGAADQTGTSGTPIDAKLDAQGLQNNGGSLTTIRLRKGSAAVDKGKDLAGLGIDETGATRPKDLADATYPNAAGGDGSDIGAFEAQSLPNDVPTVNDQQFNGSVGTAFSNVQVQANDGDGDTLTYSVVSGTLPDGLTLNSDGSITGTPTTAVDGTTVTFKVNDGMADSATKTLTFKIAELPSFVVTTDLDSTSSYDGVTSLREAMAYVLFGGAPSSTVTFDPTFFATAKTITLTQNNGPLSAAGNITINGPAAGLTISGGDLTAMLSVYSFGGTVNVNVNGITLAHGYPSSNFAGGAVQLQNYGGAPSLTLAGCTLRENGGDDVIGGAIYNNGGLLTLNSCTLSGNRADKVNNGSSAGGAIYQSAGTLTVLNCTIANNHSNGGTGGALLITGGSGTVSVGNSIIANNTTPSGTAPDISGSITSQGYNIIGNTTGATITGTTTGNQTGNPGLDPNGLANNGGPTQTIALVAGSIAIDKGKAFGGATTDQRGRVRPYDDAAVNNAAGGDGSDIGAYEVQVAAPEIVVQFPPGTDLTSGSAQIALGGIAVGSTATATPTVKNVGAVALNLTGNPKVAVSGSSEFAVTMQPDSPLGTGVSTDFVVQFAPLTAGSKVATISIANDDSDENPFTFTVTGTGVDTVTQTPTLTSPASNSATFSPVTVSFTLPEAAMAGTVKVTFNNGTAHEVALGTTEETAGNHTVSVDAATNGLTVGVYSVTLSYQDLMGNPAATTTNTNVSLRPPNAVSTAVIAQGAPAPGAGTNELPSGAILASFNLPATDDTGDLAYIAKWTSADKKTKGTGLFLNNTCLAVVGGNASAIAPNAKWKSFSDPVVENGKVVCIAKLSTGASAVVSNFTGAALEKIALTGADADDTNGAKFKAFKTVALRGGSLGFLAQITGGTGANKVTPASDLGLWVREPGAVLHLVYRDGFELGSERTVGSFVSFQSGVGSPGQGRGWLTHNGQGLVLTLNTFTDKAKTKAVVFGGNGGDTILALTGEKNNNFAPEVTDATFASFRFPALNDSLENAFYATMKVGAGGVTKADAGGIFASGANFGGSLAPYALIARVNKPAGATGANFAQFKDPVLSEDGDIAFQATLKGGAAKGAAAQTIWWKQANQPLALLAQGGARPGPDFPADAQWKSFTSLAIAGGGRGPIFAATLTPGKGGVLKTATSGVWACDFTGAPRVLFRVGDTIDGKTVKTFTLLKTLVGSTGVTRSFNDNARVVWLATFKEDKSQAIIVTEVP